MKNEETLPTLPPLMARFTPEMQLLICCARVEMSEQFRVPMMRLLAGSLDWDQLLALAGRHGMIALLQKHLSEIPARLIPAAFNKTLARQTKALRARQLFLTARMLKVSQLLTDHEIPHLHYKGIVLDHLLYGGKMLRPTGDMDILVRKEEVMAIKGLLLAEGYQPLYAEHEQQELVARKRYKDIVFVHPQHKHMIEVHWSLTTTEVGAAFIWETFTDPPQSMQIQQLALRTFSPEDLLLTLAIHGAKHQYESLRWLCDINELLRIYPEVDWGKIVERATVAGLSRALLLSLDLAAKLLGAQLPDAVEQHMVERAKLEKLTDRVCGVLAHGIDKQTGFLHLSFQVQLLDRWTDRLRFVRVIAFSLNASDVEERALPKPLYPLHYLNRAVRLLRQRGFGPLWRAFVGMVRASFPSSSTAAKK